MTLRDSDIRRFWSKVALPNEGGCMLWLAGSYRDGYGQFWIPGNKLRAHRLSLWLASGPPPSSEHHAAHSCRTPLCVAPDHLRWATRAENEADKIAHNSILRGERHHWSKLTAEQVSDIRRLYATGEFTYPRLGSMFGVAQQTVGKIVKGDRWSPPSREAS